MTVTTLAYTGAAQTFTVPAGVSFVTVECWGGQGGHATLFGKGGYTKGVLICAAGTVLNVYVGGAGGSGYSAAGGWNGGGAAGNTGVNGVVSTGSGGGASDVRSGGTALANRVIVAGGGGGGLNFAAQNYPGGDGGGTVGDSAWVGPRERLGGTQTAGFALGSGGPGRNSTGDGGSGGGYWGGRALSSGGDSPGSGGSGYIGGVVNASMTNGVRTGAGQVVITALNTVPLAPTLNQPATNASIFPTDENTFTWTVNDSDPGDAQTRADLRWRVGAVAWTTILNAATTTPSYLFFAGTFTAGTVVEWQVSTYDVTSAQSPWSASSFVNVITALVAPTITSPAAGSNQYSTPITMQWTLAAGIVGESYQTVRSSATGATGTIYTDSLTVVGSSLSAQMILDPVAGRTDYLNVRFYYRGHWSPWASSTISNQYGPPQTPLLTLTPDPATASVEVAITNPGASGGYAVTASNDITRTSPDGTAARIAKGLAPNATFTDYLPGAGANDYVVTAIAPSGTTAVSA